MRKKLFKGIASLLFVGVFLLPVAGNGTYKLINGGSFHICIEDPGYMH